MTETALTSAATETIARLADALARRLDPAALARLLRQVAESLDHAADVAEGADRPAYSADDIPF